MDKSSHSVVSISLCCSRDFHFNDIGKYSCSLQDLYAFYRPLSLRVSTWRPYDKKRQHERPAKRCRDDLHGHMDKYWSDTIWRRTAQYMLGDGMLMPSPNHGRLRLSNGDDPSLAHSAVIASDQYVSSTTEPSVQLKTTRYLTE